MINDVKQFFMYLLGNVIFSRKNVYLGAFSSFETDDGDDDDDDDDDDDFQLYEFFMYLG